MRKLILLAGILTAGILVSNTKVDAQTYRYDPTVAAGTALASGAFGNGATINTCVGFFYDSNPGGMYLNNENYTVTFVPGIAGRIMRLDFTEMAISSGDSLEVFDGLTTAATRLIVFNAGNNFPVPVTATVGNASRALTVRFRSDASLTAAGWKAGIRCVFPCQPINGVVSINGVSADATGSISVCANTPLLFSAAMSYPQSGPTPAYTQTNSLNRFAWQFGGFGTDTTANGLNTVTRTVIQRAGYYFTLTVTDTNGCFNTFPVKIKTSIKPTISAIGGNICLGDTSTITANFQKNTGFFIKPPFTGKVNVPLSDNTGTSNQCNQAYFDTIKINTFTPGLTLTNVNDFIGVTLNIEHSYMGDIDVQLIAPNGTVIQLKPFIFPNGLASSGNGTDLGEPIPGDGTLPNPSGKGYDYRFTPQATQSMIERAAPDGSSAPTHTYTGTNGTSYTGTYLPAGDYAPRKEAPTPTPFSLMVGTPLNGNWVLRYCDNFTSDNGTLFSWKLDFAPSLPSTVGPAEQYSIGLKDAAWTMLVANTGLLSSVTTGNQTLGRVFPPSSSVFNYRFRYTDSANCNYDTVVKVFANPRPLKSTFGPDTVICPNTSTTLRVANLQSNITYQWYDIAAATGTPLATGTSYTTPALSVDKIYYLKATNIALCSKIDTVKVRILIPVAVPVVVLANATLNNLTFSWQAIPNATGYLISLDSGVTYIAPNGVGGLSHTISGLHAFETRGIWVVAKGPVTCQNSIAAKFAGTTLLDELYVPNSFSPNADGKNDVWKAYGYLIKEISMKIFNQWGELIYTSNDVNKGWDGKAKSKQQPVGVYVYVLRVVDQNNKVIDKTGSINLIR